MKLSLIYWTSTEGCRKTPPRYTMPLPGDSQHLVRHFSSMKNKAFQQRQRHGDLAWNKGMLVCAGIGFLVLLLASLLHTYYLGRVKSELTTAREFYRFFMANHHQLTMGQNSLLMTDFMSAENIPRDVYVKAREGQAYAAEASLRDHLDNCRRVLGQDAFEQFTDHSSVPKPGEFLSAYSPSVEGLTLAAYDSMDETILAERNKIDKRRKWFLCTYLLGSLLVLFGGLRRKSGRVSKAKSFAWLGGAVLLAAWFVQEDAR